MSTAYPDWMPNDDGEGRSIIERISAWHKIAEHPFFAECYGDGILLDAMLAKLDQVHKYLTDLDSVDQLYPTPEENFWDDRTTPLAYSQADSERDMAARREISEQLEDDLAAGRLSIMNGWLVEAVDEHTCAGGTAESNGAHEPGCGYEPLVDLAALMIPKEA